MLRAALALAVPLVLALALAAAPAAAQDSTDEARGLFDAGRAAYEAGRYPAALDYFTRCYEITQEPSLLYNMARAAERAGEPGTALAHYRAYRPHAPPSERAEIDGRVRALEPLARREGAVVDRGGTTRPPAESSTVEVAQPEAPAPAPPSEPSILESWWLWTLVAVVVLGGVAVGLGVGLGSQPPPLVGGAVGEEIDPGRPESGRVVYALGGRF